MARVTGIGGVFFKARDPKALAQWYRERLGIAMQDWNGTQFHFADDTSPREHGYAVWALFPSDTPYFGGGSQAAMINFRVDDLDGLLASLRAAGCDVDPKVMDEGYGRFGWVTDPEGNRIELWQPAA
jgi:predicted enzyme related to lactoylglutathione lyase